MSYADMDRRDLRDGAATFEGEGNISRWACLLLRCGAAGRRFRVLPYRDGGIGKTILPLRMKIMTRTRLSSRRRSERGEARERRLVRIEMRITTERQTYHHDRSRRDHGCPPVSDASLRYDPREIVRSEPLARLGSIGKDVSGGAQWARAPLLTGRGKPNPRTGGGLLGSRLAVVGEEPPARPPRALQIAAAKENVVRTDERSPFVCGPRRRARRGSAWEKNPDGAVHLGTGPASHEQQSSPQHEQAVAKWQQRCPIGGWGRVRAWARPFAGKRPRTAEGVRLTRRTSSFGCFFADVNPDRMRAMGLPCRHSSCIRRPLRE